MSGLPSFAAFFKAVHDYPPFPWQVRLADEVLARGWPELLDLPTGVGKTSALDVALYALAAAPDRMPRRTLLVVDRRIVVDQGADHARTIAKALCKPEAQPAAVAIANRLRRLWGGKDDEDPFAVAVLRGGMPRDNDWAKRPDQPVLGVSTVDQVGSRLLFRGYGIGPRSASLHAGLLGNDTLILLDEVHLATAFAETLDAIETRFRTPRAGLPNRSALVRMSATARPTFRTMRSFSLDADDRAHPKLSLRLTASKPARLLPVKVTGKDESQKRAVIAGVAVREALELQKKGAPVVAIVVNRVDTARLAARLLANEHNEVTDALVVTGRMRPVDRDRCVQKELLPRAGADRDRSVQRKPLVVVATQCIEAGADLDFDGLVTECASLDALRQRFGRVDRRGERRESRSVVLGRSDDTAAETDDPVYGTALSATWAFLATHATGGVIGFGINELPAPIAADGKPLSELLAPVDSAPILLPAHLDAWAQTSQRPSPEPDVSLWLHGPNRNGAEVQIVWRADIGETSTEEDCTAQLSASRPSSLEAVSIPLWAAQAWLLSDDEEMSDAVADAIGERPRRTQKRAIAKRAFRWSGDDSKWIDDPQKLRAGDVLVVPASRGGISAGNFDPDDTNDVVDLGDIAQLRGRGIASLRLTKEALAYWCLDSEVLAAMPLPIDDEPPRDATGRIRDWIESWPVEPPAAFKGTEKNWRNARAALARCKTQIVSEHFVIESRLSRKELEHEAEVEDAVSEDDDSSFRQVEVTLKRHSTDVHDFAKGFATVLGFSPSLVADVARAAWLHDVGKADPRFQQWLVGGSEIRVAALVEPLAKSALPAGNRHSRELARKQARYPKGYRHELLSLAMIAANEGALKDVTDKDLVLHLVASHHGWCRPMAPFADHPEDIMVHVNHDGAALSAATRHGLGRLDSGVAERFWSLVERYGWWGLAWLEAVVRLADHRASEKEAGGGA